MCVAYAAALANSAGLSILNAVKPVLFQIQASTRTMFLSSGVASSYTPPPYQRILSCAVPPPVAANVLGAAAPAAPAAALTWKNSPRESGSLMELPRWA